MKLIEAHHKVKANRVKIDDLKKKIAQYSAHMSHETPEYGDNTANQIKEWLQAHHDISRETIDLLLAIQRTNLATNVTITFPSGNSVTNNISYWVWRKRSFADLDRMAWSSLTDKNLREVGRIVQSDGSAKETKIIRNYDPRERDKKILEFSSEGQLISSALEIANAITDIQMS